MPGAVPGQCKNNLDDDGDGFVNDGCSEMEFFLNGTHVDDTSIVFDPYSFERARLSDVRDE